MLISREGHNWKDVLSPKWWAYNRWAYKREAAYNRGFTVYNNLCIGVPSPPKEYSTTSKRLSIFLEYPQYVYFPLFT